MAVIMGSDMAVVMMGFMWQMYPVKRVNVAIMGTAVVVGIAAFGASQTQAFVDDTACGGREPFLGRRGLHPQPRSTKGLNHPDWLGWLFILGSERE